MPKELYDKAPDYYAVVLPSGENVACWDLIDALNLSRDYYLASAFAYLWRADSKPGSPETADVRKAYNFLGRWLEVNAPPPSEPVQEDLDFYGSIKEYDSTPLDDEVETVAPEPPHKKLNETFRDRLKALLQRTGDVE